VLKAPAQHAVFRSLCHDLIGPGARLYRDQSVYKKSGKPQEFPRHQDNGCPWIAPGRHTQGTLAHWRTPIRPANS
jgi:hypothetical protein